MVRQSHIISCQCLPALAVCIEQNVTGLQEVNLRMIQRDCVELLNHQTSISTSFSWRLENVWLRVDVVSSSQQGNPFNQAES